jgi:hypothetical protein
MRIFMAAVLIAFSTTCVCAQHGIGKGGGKPPEKSAAELAEEKKNRQIEEKAYNDAVSRIPDKTPAKKPDPWGNVR